MAAKAKPVPTVKRARKPISEKAIFVTLSARDHALVERYGTIAIPANDELYEIFRYVLGVFEGDVEKTDWRYLYVNGG